MVGINVTFNFNDGGTMGNFRKSYKESDYVAIGGKRYKGRPPMEQLHEEIFGTFMEMEKDKYINTNIITSFFIEHFSET